jgi:soluble lytic murein transglycosylase-like protein
MLARFHCSVARLLLACRRLARLQPGRRRPPRLQPLRLRLALRAIPILAIPALCSPAWATPPLASPSQLCEAAIVSAERAERLPERMMGAIAVVETGRADPAGGAPRPWPWTINAEGQGFFFTSKQQAIEAVRALQARGVRSIDVGCMQVNLMFHPNAFASLDQAFDPDANARYAARFLTALHGENRDWPAAIAAYHSETPALGAAYRQLVMARWDRPGMIASIVHYADFTPRSASYRDFLPNSQVYGAFANAIDARPAAALR